MALLLLLCGCAGGPQRCDSVPPGPDSVTVISRGWHTELAVPASSLVGPLVRFRTLFPQARTLLFGYGKRTFMTAPTDDVREYLLGPFPGPAVIEVVGLSGTPQQAYGTGDSVTLPLPPGGDAALSAFIWNDLALDATGAPLLVGPGGFQGSLFYAARSQYTLAHTCNGWVATALQAAGLPVSPVGIVFSGQLMNRTAAAQQCQTPDR